MIVVLHVSSNVFLRDVEAGVAITVHPFRFIAPKESLHWGVIPAIASTAHTWLHLVAPQLLLKRFTGVMASLI